MFELKKYINNFLSSIQIKQKTNLVHPLAEDLYELLEYRVQNIDLFIEAFSLKSTNSGRKNYERLEFLGDSVLGTIISCHLFENYPEKNEGFLTQMKSKLVNRKNLNEIGSELNIRRFIYTPLDEVATLSKNIDGNLFESLIGALYLDAGYEKTKDILLKRLLTEEKIEFLEHKIISYKSLLLEWSQKTKHKIKYDTQKEDVPNAHHIFRACIYLEDDKISTATETSKKKAEEKAAQRAFYSLNKTKKILEKK